MDQQELNYWKKQYPEFSEEEIVDICEAVEDGEMEFLPEEPSNFTDYLNPKPVKETGLKGILQNILHKKDS